MITPKITNLGYSNLWTDMSTILGYQPNLDQYISKLFANNEQGFVFDPNDLSTMYQNAVGTVPVTGAGQPVGLMLDKSKGLVLGSEAIVGGNFENGLIGTLANSALSAGTLTLNTVSPISGTQDARVTVTAVDGLNPQLRFNRNVPRIVGALYEFSFDYKVLSGSPYIAQIYNGAGTDGVVKTLSGSGKFTARYMARGVGTSIDQIYFTSNTFDIQIDNVSVKEIKGNHAYQTTSSSRPILRQNATTGAYYLEFDGTDDFFVTNNIDFTATDKVSLFAGVRKLSDAATGMLMELSTSADTNPNSFYLAAPLTTSSFRFYTKGNSATAMAVAVPLNVAPSPISCVTTVKSAMVNGGDVTLKVNQQPYTSKNTTAIGNYGNYPLYIGRRGGISFPFNGHIYGLIGIGKLVSDTELAVIEKELAKRTGVTLNV